MKKTVITSFFVIFFFQEIFAQEFIGLRTDNYSGSNGMLLNPATPISGSLPWDINIIAGGAAAYNNYVYADNSSVFSLMNNTDSTELLYRDITQAKAHENGFLQLPSAFLKMGDYAFGFFITGRTAGFVQSAQYPPGLNSLHNIADGVETTIPEFDAAVLNWMEIGVNAEMILQNNASGKIYVGANLKYLGGFDGLYFHNTEEFTFVKDSLTTDFTNLNMQYAFTNNLGSSDIMDPSNYAINGWGLGADLGIFYTIAGDFKKSVYADYDWKLGASLVDIGYIHFKDNAGTYVLTSENVFDMATADLDSISDLVEFNRTGSRTLFDNGSESQTGTVFNVMLPAALTLTADKNFGKGFFANALIVRRLSFINKNMVARANIFAISPRYETRWFGFTVPVSLYEDRDIHAGVAVRLFFLTVGTDNIISWIAPAEFDGSDFYAGIKINPVWLTNIKKSKKYKAGKQLDCPPVINPNNF
ncbi:MAG: hypothetical protein H7X71_05045 [Chitinophagales bacterium]|nr:hypothetical protein [Chitinophagales bacterium]